MDLLMNFIVIEKDVRSKVTSENKDQFQGGFDQMEFAVKSKLLAQPDPEATCLKQSIQPTGLPTVYCLTEDAEAAS